MTAYKIIQFYGRRLGCAALCGAIFSLVFWHINGNIPVIDIFNEDIIHYAHPPKEIETVTREKCIHKEKKWNPYLIPDPACYTSRSDVIVIDKNVWIGGKEWLYLRGCQEDKEKKEEARRHQRINEEARFGRQLSGGIITEQIRDPMPHRECIVFEYSYVKSVDRKLVVKFGFLRWLEYWWELHVLIGVALIISAIMAWPHRPPPET